MGASVQAVEVSGVAVSFGETRALDGVDLSVSRGTVQGLLGPNGAGKTTLVRVLATLLRPGAGSARVVRLRRGERRDPSARTDRARGSVRGRRRHAHRPGEPRDGRPAVPAEPEGAKRRALESLERLGLTEAADRVVKGYSGGMRRRLDLGASLVGRPRLLILDEPTTGLDPQSRSDCGPSSANWWTTARPSS